MRWNLASVIEDASAVIDRAEMDLRTEQAVHGLDARTERELQDLLARGLASSYEVTREAHYPSGRADGATARQRCDLVLAPAHQPLERNANRPTLLDRRARCPPEEALWLEMKVACQFRADGRPNRRYAAQWRIGVVEDLRKMELEPRIQEAAFLLIVFNDSPATLARHLDLLEQTLVEKQVFAGFRQVRSVPVLERRGHGVCSVALWPTIQR